MDPGRAAARTPSTASNASATAPIYEYDDLRDDPAAAATSRLSPHLSFGTLGPREVLDAVESAKADAPDGDARPNAEG